MTVQLDILSAIEEKNKGIEKAISHANAVSDQWSERAYQFLLKFLNVHRGPFQAEEFRSYCALMDFELPPHARAFGGIMLKANKAGLIKKVGVKEVRNPKAHRCFSTLWIQAKNVA